MNRMMLIVVASCGAVAMAQNDPVHITIDTASGQDGDQIITDVGWHMDEDMYAWGQNRQLTKDGEVHVFVLNEVYVGGDWDGRYFGAGPRLTTDFYFPTGRTQGGDFYFEIVDVVEVNGRDPAVFGWGENHNGMLMNNGESDGATREERSYYARNNYHMHHQIESMTAMGLYDVTLVAWDGNGKFVDAEAFTLRYEVVPTPGGVAVLGIAGLVASRRRR